LSIIVLRARWNHKPEHLVKTRAFCKILWLAKQEMLRSLITIRERSSIMDKTLSAIHPGEVLLEDFMKPLKLTQYRLAIYISRV